MRIVVHLPTSEAHRSIECEEENIREAYREVIRQIENVCCRHQIRYSDIEVTETEARDGGR